MVKDAVRQLIRQRIEDGLRPRDRTASWHGSGFGQICDGCGLPIATTGMISLICGARLESDSISRRLYRAWDAERAPSLAGRLDTQRDPTITQPIPPTGTRRGERPPRAASSARHTVRGRAKPPRGKVDRPIDREVPPETIGRSGCSGLVRTQVDPKGRTSSGIVLDQEATAVGLDDRAADRQPHA